MACSSNRQNRFISLTKLAKFSPSQSPYQDHPNRYVDGRTLVQTEVEFCFSSFIAKSFLDATVDRDLPEFMDQVEKPVLVVL